MKPAPSLLLAALTVATPIFAAPVLTGCKLIDRQTFGAAAPPPAAADIAESTQPEQRTPLVTVRFQDPNANIDAPIRDAIARAEAARPNLRYEIVATVPRQPDPDAQVQAIETGREDAATVMRILMDTGIPATRIQIGARIDDATALRDVRIYVR